MCARLDLLGQADWWVTATGWRQYLETYTATREIVYTEDAYGWKLPAPQTMNVPAFHRVEDRLAAVGTHDLAVIKVADMTVGHRQNVLALLTRLRHALFVTYYWNIGNGLPAYDDVQQFVNDEIDEAAACFTDDAKLTAWFNKFPLVAALRAANIADKETRLGRAVLLEPSSS